MRKKDFAYFAPESLSTAYELKKENANSAYIGGGTAFCRT